MDIILSAKIIPIAKDTTLNENDIISYWQIIDGKKTRVEYKVLGAKHDFFEGMVPVMEMSIGGKALKENKRIVFSFPFDFFIENSFDLLIDESYDQMFWPKNLNEAIAKLRLEYTNDQLAEISRMTFDEYENNYLFLGSWIRNYFGLWRGNYDLLINCDENDASADNVSSVIKKGFFNSLQV